MQCPACGMPLITAEIDGVELDYCVADGGVWLDEGEIEALFKSTVAVLKDAQGRPGRRRCPRCRSRLHVFSPAPSLELDLCAAGDGVWFDAGELKRLADALASGSRPELAAVFKTLSGLVRPGDAEVPR
ncbi:MAG: zf-TFIIB domain-containing protein [Deltaproteobacteria bacterium]|nr:zf-TFIIB domain-containing protein [Deltaproteobacteria bacterium]